MKDILTIRIFVTTLLSLSLFSCSGKKTNTDEYYTDHGDWDDVRFPLIRPYEALCLNGSHDWIVQKTPDSMSVFSAPNTRKVNIVDHVIFLYSTKTLLNYTRIEQAWFILIPAKHIEKGFATHQEYINYLYSIGIKHEPKLYDMDQISRYFGNRDTIDWQHIDN